MWSGDKGAIDAQEEINAVCPNCFHRAFIYNNFLDIIKKFDFLTKLLTVAILITMQVNILDTKKYMDTTQQPYSGKYKHNVSFPMLKNNRRPSIKANTKGTTIKNIIVQLNRFSLL